MISVTVKSTKDASWTPSPMRVICRRGQRAATGTPCATHVFRNLGHARALSCREASPGHLKEEGDAVAPHEEFDDPPHRDD